MHDMMKAQLKDAIKNVQTKFATILEKFKKQLIGSKDNINTALMNAYQNILGSAETINSVLTSVQKDVLGSGGMISSINTDIISRYISQLKKAIKEQTNLVLDTCDSEIRGIIDEAAS